MVTKTDVLPDLVDSASSGRDEHLARHTGCYALCYDKGTEAAVGRAPKSVWEDMGGLLKQVIDKQSSERCGGRQRGSRTGGCPRQRSQLV